MKLVKVSIVVGLFFLAMQFITVQIFDSMMSISETHSLPTAQLERMQVLIMEVILCSLIAFGILFLVLIAALIRSTFRARDRTEGEPA